MRRRVSLTTDPGDPRLTHGVDAEPAGQADAYLILSEEERAKGFVRPVRRSYRHVGERGPRYGLRDLTAKQRERYDRFGYVKYEPYPADEAGLGRFWTQAALDSAAGGGCRTVTTMALPLAETYARQPGFYGATYCAGCGRHLKVGRDGEFTWMNEDGTDSEWRVGE